MCGTVVAMEDIYEEATEGFEVGSSTSRRILALIRDALDLEIAISGFGVFVEALPQPPYGICQTLGRFNTMLEAQNFAWAGPTGPYGVVRDVRFTELRPNLFGVDFEVLIQDIRECLKGWENAC